MGTGRNTIPGRAFIEAEIRSYVEADLRSALREFLEEIQNVTKTIDVEINHETENPELLSSQ